MRYHWDITLHLRGLQRSLTDCWKKRLCVGYTAEPLLWGKMEWWEQSPLQPESIQALRHVIISPLLWSAMYLRAFQPRWPLVTMIKGETKLLLCLTPIFCCVPTSFSQKQKTKKKNKLLQKAKSFMYFLQRPSTAFRLQPMVLFVDHCHWQYLQCVTGSLSTARHFAHIPLRCRGHFGRRQTVALFVWIEQAGGDLKTKKHVTSLWAASDLKRLRNFSFFPKPLLPQLSP